MTAWLKFLFRFYPFVSGQNETANLTLVRKILEGAGDAPRKASFKKFSILARLNDRHGRCAFLFGCNDGKVRDVFKRLVRPGDTVLDMGANYGMYSLLSCGLAGPSGQVHAFEANPDLAELMRESAKINGFDNLTVHAAALSDHEGKANLYVPMRDSGLASLSDQGSGQARAVEVPLKETGPYLESLSLGPIKLLKSDLEDHDFAVLSSARSVLEKNPPACILFECHTVAVPFWESDLVELLSSLGYEEFYSVPRTFFKTRLVKQARGDNETGLSRNFLAVHRTQKGKLP